MYKRQPVLLKDNIATSGGLHTTAGVYALKDWQPARDAFLVQQLRNAGALVLGKANLSEWANYMDPCMPSGFSACLLYTSPSPRDRTRSRMPSSA